MYGWGAATMPVVLSLGTLTGIGAYSQSKEKMWLYGAATIFAVIPFTFLVMKKTNDELKKVLRESGDKVELD